MSVRIGTSGWEYAGWKGSFHLLGTWADRMADRATAGLPVWAYFNNDIDGHAVRDAHRLREMVERRLVRR